MLRRRGAYTLGVDPDLRHRAIGQVTSRLKFPQLLAITGVLLLVDLIVPDLIPFADEILLAVLTALFAFWREPVAPAADKPPEKNVTPPKQMPR
jgi:hypothetical protein